MWRHGSRIAFSSRRTGTTRISTPWNYAFGGQCIGTGREAKIGDPDEAHISTSYIERSNLTLRMANRRFTRLTNAFSKKLANHCHMIALYTVWYNFVKMHKTLKMTPALAANVSDILWSMDKLVALVDAHDVAKPRQKPGRKPKAQ